MKFVPRMRLNGKKVSETRIVQEISDMVLGTGSRPYPIPMTEEVKMIVKPTNKSTTSPSFVFDFLACNVKKYREYSKVNSDVFFTWVESKTGHVIFSGSQIRTMSKIELPLAIFHIDNVLAKPKDIRMIYDLKSGKEWLKELTPIENELYEFA